MKFTLIRWIYLALLLLLAGCGPSLRTATLPSSIPALSQQDIARSGFFYVGGEYVGEAGKEIMRGAMYVEVRVPVHVRHAEPIVLLHGVGQTGVDWLQTPDGRAGWAYNFLKQGYVVYIADLPGRGRSAFVPELDGALGIRTAPQLSQLWTATQQLGRWPDANKHTQWPGEGNGKGRIGDTTFDAFARTQVQFPVTGLDQQVVDAGVALLDRIGVPVILLTHSQAGAFGWSLADARPQQVRAIVAVEPAGPPIQNVDVATQTYNGKSNLPWGLTNLPLAYEPAITDSAQLQTSLVASEAGTMPCYLQTGTPHTLPHLKNIPVLLVAGEASYHRTFDHCTARWLQQAGVKTEYLELQRVGITGNGHMMMLERNSDAIAEWLVNWMRKMLQ